MTSISGRCRCGAVSYEIEVDALPPVYACHCHVCQRWSGSAFSLQALVPEDKLSARGPVREQDFVTEDRTSTQRFCAACHTRLYNTNTQRPGIAVVRAGTLDRSEELECCAHIYIDFKQRWVVLPGDVPTWGEAAPADAFVAALSGQRLTPSAPPPPGQPVS